MDENRIDEEESELARQARKLADEQNARVEKRKRLSIRRQVKNRVILWIAAIGGLILVWQKLRIWIVIPGSFLHLALIVGGVIGLIWFVLDRIARD